MNSDIPPRDDALHRSPRPSPMTQSFNSQGLPFEQSHQDPARSRLLGPDAEDSDPKLSEILLPLLRYWWVMLIATSIGLGWGAWTWFQSKPSYQSTALIFVDRAGSKFTPQFEVPGLTSPIAAAFSDPVGSERERAIMGSRLFLRSLLADLNLDIQARPLYQPLIGEAIAQRYPKDSSVARPWFGQEEYAWGGERIAVESIEVPEQLRGTWFRLVAGEEGHYQLLSKDTEILRGKVGERAEGRLGEERISIFVSRLKARPETEFLVTRLTEQSAINVLRAGFSMEESPPKSGLLRISFRGDDPYRVANIANAIARTYQRRNLEERSAQADQTLAFLETQLPEVKNRLDAAEDAYNSYLADVGYIDMQNATSETMDRIVKLDADLKRLLLQQDEQRLVYGPEHHRIAALDRQIERIRTERVLLEQEMGRLPDEQKIAATLTRDIRANERAYRELIDAIQSLRIARAGTVGNVQIIDDALPGSPILPNRNRLLIKTGGLGFLTGLGLAFILVKLRSRVEDPEQIERQIGVTVYASIPYSRVQERFSKLAKRHHTTAEAGVVAIDFPTDIVAETFRSLRTSMHFILVESKSNVVLISGPQPGVGKSFVSMNLGAVLAQANKKVLIIDADMRRGRLHHPLGVAQAPGLSEFIIGQTELSEAIKQSRIEGLSLIPTGRHPPNPSELLMSRSFSRLIETVSHDYDYVILDAPPALVVADAGVLGMHAGAALLVARSGRHHMAELEATVRQLAQAGTQVKGFVLNGVMPHHGFGYGYGYKYGYRYYRYGGGYRSSYQAYLSDKPKKT